MKPSFPRFGTLSSVVALTVCASVLSACGGDNGQTGTSAASATLATVGVRANDLTTPLARGRYTLVSALSNKCVDAPLPAKIDGGKIRQANCHNGLTQVFDLTQEANNSYKLVNVATGQVMDLASSSTSDGAAIHQWSNNNSNAQRFKLERTQGNRFSLVNAGSGKCVAIGGASMDDGAGLQQASCNAEAPQQFLFYPVFDNTRAPLALGQYALRSAFSNLCVEVIGGSNADGAKTQQASCNNEARQRFEVQVGADQGYSFFNVASGKVIDVSDVSTANGAVIHQWSYVGGTNQRFALAPSGNGYTVRAKHSNKCMDVKDFSTATGGQIVQWDCSGNSNQSWNVIPANSGNNPAPVCPAWNARTTYSAGNVIADQGNIYTATVPHTLAEGVNWRPGETPQLWNKGGTCAGVPNAAPAKFALPPATWQEHWFEHADNLKLVAYNDAVALYFDNGMDRNAGKWMMAYLTKLWPYAQRTYGHLNTDRLYSIHHESRHWGGHPATVYDASHDFRNVSDVGGQNWLTPQYGVVTHETAHVVEFSASGKSGSPAFPLWGDSKWAEFYHYDAMVALGMNKEADDAFREFTADTKVDNFPNANTHWFRDWFYPLWRDHGHAQVMVNYFNLLGQYYPTNGQQFQRNLNWGEYIHFMSGAAKKDLRPLARNAFQWQSAWDGQYAQAKRDFPAIQY
ncbi:MAG: RICIN domain-containing protein [Pseudomonadota bacterium]